MFFSLSLTASSIAISQKGLMIYLPDKSTPDPSGLTLIFSNPKMIVKQIEPFIFDKREVKSTKLTLLVLLLLLVLL
jgi:hypothetical protein